MDRRKFLRSLAGLTAALSLPLDGLLSQEGQDKFGKLLPLRKLGGTGESVTMLGVGGWHIGRMSEREAQKTIELAIEQGIRFFDSAEGYQNGGSEERFGKLLVPKYREQVYIMTKTGARDAKSAQADLNDSLRRMNTDYLDLWQMHAVGSPDDVDNRIDSGVLDVMLEAKASGKVRHIGFTGHRHPSAHLRALERTDELDACQMPVNVADLSNNSFIEHVLPVLIEKDVAPLAMKTLGNGGFFGGNRHGQHGDGPKVVPERVTVSEAIQFAWSFPVSTLITGPDDADMLQEKITIARQFQELAESERQMLVEKVADIAAEVEFYKA
jgi:predicted aldo/keto reductase-like oxidoreductase